MSEVRPAPFWLVGVAVTVMVASKGAVGDDVPLIEQVRFATGRRVPTG
jgi:hypothetical protein